MKAGHMLVAATAAILLTGCKTIDSVNGPVYASVNGRMMDNAAAYRIADAGPGYIQTLKEERAAAGEGLSESDYLGGNAALSHSEPLAAYAERVLAKLAAAWTGGSQVPPLRVIISAEPGYGARVFEDGTVVIDQGLLVNAESEDELAFILAHELSHVLLNHSDNHGHHERRTKTRQLLSAVAVGVAGESQQQGIGLAVAGLGMLHEQLLEPMWSREQEDLADLLGIDLSVRAGYSYRGGLIAMQRLHAQAQRGAARREADQEAYDSLVDQHMRAGRVNEGINLALGRLSQAPTAIIGAIAEEVSASHSSPLDREGDIKGYVAREYGGGWPRPLQKDAYERHVLSGPGLRALTRSVLAQRAEGLVQEGRLDEAARLLVEALDSATDPDPSLRLSLYQVRRAQGNMADAIKNLEIARSGPHAPPHLFDLLIAAHVERQRPRDALEVLDDKVRRFGDAASALPLRLALLLKNGDAPAARAVEHQCRQSPDKSIAHACGTVVRDWERAQEKDRTT